MLTYNSNIEVLKRDIESKYNCVVKYSDISDNCDMFLFIESDSDVFEYAYSKPCELEEALEAVLELGFTEAEEKLFN